MLFRSHFFTFMLLRQVHYAAMGSCGTAYENGILVDSADRSHLTSPQAVSLREGLIIKPLAGGALEVRLGYWEVGRSYMAV